MKYRVVAACCAFFALAARPAQTVTGAIPAQYIDRIAAAGDIIVRGRKTSVIHDSVPRDGARIEISGGRLLFPGAASVHLEVPRSLRALSLTSAAGSVDVSDMDGSVLAAASAGKITVDRIGGDVEIQSGGGPALIGTVSGRVRCFSRGGNIRAVRVRGDSVFQTGGGDIQIGDANGAIRAATAAGGIRIEQARSHVFVETLGGPISILRAFGLVEVESEGGPIEVGSATSVRCRSASGAIRLNNVSGALNASTERGSIVAEILRGQPLAPSFLSTGMGDITVFVPSDTGVSIEAESAGTRDERSIVSDFRGVQIVPRRSSVRARGGINGGGPLLRLLGAGGRIFIRRK